MLLPRLLYLCLLNHEIITVSAKISSGVLRHHISENVTSLESGASPTQIDDGCIEIAGDRYCPPGPAPDGASSLDGPASAGATSQVASPGGLAEEGPAPSPLGSGMYRGGSPREQGQGA